jgi:hypothetical protein
MQEPTRVLGSQRNVKITPFRHSRSLLSGNPDLHNELDSGLRPAGMTASKTIFRFNDREGSE